MNLIRNLAVVIAVFGSASVAETLPISSSQIEIEAAAGRTWLDLDGDGAFELRGTDSSTTSSYLFGADTRLDEFNDVINVSRSGLEFNLEPISTLPFPEIQVVSATLTLHFFSSRDVVNFPPPDFGPPTGLLHGYFGDGVVSAEDMLVDSVLTEFLAPADTTINIDVTDFVRLSAFLDQPFASFMLQLENDYQRGNNASAYYGSRHLDDLTFRPRLVIEIIGDPKPIDIDIKPGDSPECGGVIPVAVLGSESLDVSQIDPSTLSFEGLSVKEKGNGALSCDVEDINFDGIADYVCQYRNGLTQGTLTGELLDGTPIEGDDAFCVKN